MPAIRSVRSATKGLIAAVSTVAVYKRRPTAPIAVPSWYESFGQAKGFAEKSVVVAKICEEIKGSQEFKDIAAVNFPEFTKKSLNNYVRKIVLVSWPHITKRLPESAKFYFNASEFLLKIFGQSLKDKLANFIVQLLAKVIGQEEEERRVVNRELLMIEWH